MARISSLASGIAAITSLAASASHSPRSKLRRQYSAGGDPVIAAARRARWAGLYETEMKLSSSTLKPSGPRGVKRAAAALIPSSDVPDISPTTMFFISRSNRRRCVGDHASDDSAVVREELLGDFPRDISFLHHDRRLYTLAGSLEKCGCFILTHAADF